MLPARALLAMFDAAYLLALTSLVGSIAFFSFGVAPIIFGVLGAEGGARFVRALFPRYYLWGAISAAVALPAFIAGPLSFPEYRGPWVAVQALAIVASALILLYCGNALTPAINAARDAGPAGSARFDRLHRLSVRLNAAVLLLGVGLIVAHAARPTPTTRGIVEQAPEDKGAYDAEVFRYLDALGTELDGADAPKSPSTSRAYRESPLEADAKRELWGLLVSRRDRDAARIKAMAR